MIYTFLKLRINISFIFSLALLLYPSILFSSEKGVSNRKVSVYGFLGSKIDLCIEKRVKTENIKELTDVFKHKNEKKRWQTEFWGKWVQGAIESWKYNNDPLLYGMIRESACSVIESQEKNGYIGNYSPEFQLDQWDIWGRKYTMLGLLNYYLISKDKKALKAVEKMFQHLKSQLEEKGKRIIDTGNYRGMASSSILEPIMLLYNITKDDRYLTFAKDIVAQWEENDGPHLISYSDKPVSMRFPFPKVWFSRENGQKAYEMMSCYEGLLELYKVTNDDKYLQAVINTYNHIVSEEINIAGSGSAFECWYGGLAKETIPTYHTMETCVTFTWMQFCNRLYNVTHNPLIMDQIEKSMYNALLSSFKGDGSQIAKYSPLVGYHSPGEEQCGLHINCCNANGPRAFAMIPNIIYHVNAGKLYVNQFIDSKAKLRLNELNIGIIQHTDYPKGDRITLSLTLNKPGRFDILIRIPQWSEKNVLKVNGTICDKPVVAGKYISLNREWKDGDIIELVPDMRARIIRKNGFQAIQRGPIVLARDTRFDDGYVDQEARIVDKDGYLDLKPVDTPNAFSWMTFTVPMILGTDLENGNYATKIHFCDFASAGDTWDKKQRYRVWIPQTLNVIKAKYQGY